MAVGRWKVDRTILLACLAVVAFLLVVNVLAGTCLDADKSKMKANEIASPWDRSAAPPVMGPSAVTVSPLPKISQVPEPGAKNAKLACHRHRRHWSQQTAYAGQ